MISFITNKIVIIVLIVLITTFSVSAQQASDSSKVENYVF
jgi:hypothetical protein